MPVRNVVHSELREWVVCDTPADDVLKIFLGESHRTGRIETLYLLPASGTIVRNVRMADIAGRWEQLNLSADDRKASKHPVPAVHFRSAIDGGTGSHSRIASCRVGKLAPSPMRVTNKREEVTCERCRNSRNFKKAS
jgi:hypothetical protein